MENWADVATHTLRAYYLQPVVSGYNLDEALDALVILTRREERLVYTEKQKKLLMN